MVTAFVLINLQDKDLKKMAGVLLALPGVAEVHALAGEYDMVAVIRVSDSSELSELITGKLVHTSGILHTKTLLSLKEYKGKA